VHVIAPEACDGVRALAAAGDVAWTERPFAAGDLDGHFLAIAATSDTDTNIAVFEEAERRSMLCNVVDVPALCNFILPSIMRKGDLAIAVSTAGASPALARKIRLELEQLYGEEYELALELLGSLRDELKARYPDPHDRKIIFERIVYSDFMEMLRRGDTDELEAWVERCIEEGADYAPADAHRDTIAAALAGEPKFAATTTRSPSGTERG
jgi:siroheme synthase-like protein